MINIKNKICFRLIFIKIIFTIMKDFLTIERDEINYHKKFLKKTQNHFIYGLSFIKEEYNKIKIYIICK